MMNERDFYYKATDKNGAVSINYARVWDVDRFIAAITKQHEKEGGHVTVATEQEYKQAHKKQNG